MRRMVSTLRSPITSPVRRRGCATGCFCRSRVNTARRDAVFQDVIRSLDKAGKAFIRDQREWYNIAKRQS